MSTPKVGADQWLEQIKNIQNHGEEQKIASHVHRYIFTVPESLRIERQEAYVPQVASLGPYHHLKLELYEAERYKSRLTIQVEKSAKKGPFEVLVKEIINMAQEIRNSYNDPIKCNNEVLGWTMARDAVFILEFLGCYNLCKSPRYQEANPYLQCVDAVFHPERKSPLFFPFQADIFKLENQVPLFILKKVLAWETGSEDQAMDRLKMAISSACKKFSPFIPVKESYHSLTRAHSNISLDERHILECLYNFVIPNENAGQVSVSVEDGPNRTVARFKSFHFLRQITSRFREFLSQSPKSRVKPDKNLPSAAELHRRGVKFAPFTWASEKIRFDRASSTLFLPCIEMDYRTDVFLRNMVAVEAFMMWKTRVFTCYADLMDRLIDTPSDVAVLKRYGIITSDLGSDKEISNLWNGIRRSIWRSAYEPIDQTIKDVNAYYRSRYGVLLGEFLQEHFSNPWRAASVVGACTLLVLAFLQTLFSYYQLHPCYHHHKP
ncbi:putative UPF0481 protein At3g02645 [Cryptomeria japonica]|uniref:putative UPF0481 protein At3g02645 n=1 Tax=Cryptomeria japonica TaxID=3369 RepID=UPI0027DA842D|nr:putative UPF0481 protein At3g02645 [Cryptomeria japonica]XP_057838978.2 putative UPF0481 protein At3g02645 [Cryptomeria japonica]